jgi:hypothetical protein
VGVVNRQIKNQKAKIKIKNEERTGPQRQALAFPAGRGLASPAFIFDFCLLIFAF